MHAQVGDEAEIVVGDEAEIVAAVEAGAHGLVSLSQRADSTAALHSLSQRGGKRLWAAAAQHVSNALEQVVPAMEREGEMEADAGVKAGLATLLASATLARMSVNACDTPTSDLLAITEALHDVIFEMKEG